MLDKQSSISQDTPLDLLSLLLTLNEDDDEAADIPGMTALGDVRLAVCPGEHHLIMSGFLVVKQYSKTLHLLTPYVAKPRLPEFIQQFLYDQLYSDANLCGMDVPLEACPEVPSTLEVKVFHFALATYHTPSDLSGIGGMHHEWIRATPSWQNGAGRYDCIFIDREPEMHQQNVISLKQLNCLILPFFPLFFTFFKTVS